MPSFLSKIKALASPSLSKRNAKSHNDLSNDASLHPYIVKEKDLPKLHLAAWRGDMAKVSEFCRADKINMQDKDGRTPLHLAVAANHKLIANYLINEDAKFHYLDKENRTIFTLATMNGNSDILRLLLSSCKEKDIINTVDKKKLNALHYAIRNEKAISLLRILLDCNKIDLNHRDKDGNTVLHVATKLHNYEAVQLLIQRQADIDALNGDGATSLILAAEVGDEVLVKFFLENGCNKNIKDKHNKSAEDYSKAYPTCLSVLNGVGRPKSFSAASKYVKSGKPPASQPNRRASWNEASVSEHVQSSKGENKFENLFAAAAITHLNEPNDSESNTSKMDGSSGDHNEHEHNEHEGPLTGRSEKVSTWNDNDSDVLDDIIVHKNASANHNDTITPKQQQPPHSVVNSFISGLGAGYEAQRKELDKKPVEEKDTKNSVVASFVQSFVPNQMHSKKADPDSWNDHDSFIGSGPNSPIPQSPGPNSPEPQSPKKSMTENYDSIFNTFTGDHPKKHDKKDDVVREPTIKDENSWLSDSFAGVLDDGVKNKAAATTDRARSPVSDRAKSPVTNSDDKLSSLMISNLLEKDKKHATAAPKRESEWFITVYTSNIRSAGTDARVFIKIFGTQANTEKIFLDKEEYQNKLFEKGSVDKFLKSIPDIGEPIKITIGHDNTGPFPGWHLDKVVLNDIRQKKEYEFACARWLAKNEGDRKIEINIRLDGEPDETDDKAMENSWNSSDDEDSNAFAHNKEKLFRSQTPTKQIDPPKQQQQQDILKTSSTSQQNIFANAIIASALKNDSTDHEPQISDVEDDSMGHVRKSYTMDSPIIPPKHQIGIISSSIGTPHGFSNSQQLIVQTQNKAIDESSDDDEDLSTAAIERELNLTKNRVTAVSLNDLQKQQPLTEFRDEEHEEDDYDYYDNQNGIFSAYITNLKPASSTTTTPPPQNVSRTNSMSSFGHATSNPAINERQPMKTFSVGGLSRDNSIKNEPSNSTKDIEMVKPKLSLSAETQSNSGSTPALNALIKGLTSGNYSSSQSKQSLADDSGLASMGSTINHEKMLKTEQKSIKSISSNIDELVTSITQKKRDFENNKHQSPNDSSNPASRNESFKTTDNGKKLFNTMPNPSTGTTVTAAPALFSTFTTKTITTSTAESAKDSYNVGNLIAAFGGNHSVHKASPPAKHVKGLNELIDDLKQTRNKKPQNPEILITSNESDFEESFSSDMDENMAFNVEPPPNFQKTDTKNDIRKPVYIISDDDTSGADIVARNLNALANKSTANTTTKTSVNSKILSKIQFDQNIKALNQQLEQKQNEIQRLTTLLQETMQQKNDLEFKKNSLDNQLKILNEQKNTFELDLRKTEQKLFEKEKLQFELVNSNNKSDTLTKSNTVEIQNLRKEIQELKEEKSKLEARVATLQTAAAANTTSNSNSTLLMNTLSEQNEKLTIEIKALKQQIEELNKDRYSLSECKEQLTSRLDESEMNVNMRQEALEKAVMQYSLEKAVLKDENLRIKTELHEIIDSKRKLTDDIQKLQLNVKECQIEIDRLSKEKLDLEKMLDRERNDKDSVRQRYDHEISGQKDHHIQLIEKLSSTEAKLMAIENECNNSKNLLQEKQNQLDSVKDELIKLKLEFNLKENQLVKEKEERIRLSAKNETIQERLKTVLDENDKLKKQYQDYVDNHKIEKLQNVSLKELERKKNESEKEMGLLKQDLTILNQKLYNAEYELTTQKNILKDSLRSQDSDIRISQAHTTAARQQDRDVKILETDNSYLDESRKLKNELEKLRNDFQNLLEKYETKETEKVNAVNETEQKYHDLINKINSSKSDLNSLINTLQLRTTAQLPPPPPTYDPYNPYNRYMPPPLPPQQAPLPPPQQATIPHRHYGYNRLGSTDRTTIIVPNCEIILPKNSQQNQTQYANDYNSSTSYMNMAPLSCEKCTGETQAYVDILRSEIAKAIEIQVAKETPFSNLNYRSSFGAGDNDYDYRGSMHDYSTASIDLVNSLRTKYFL